MHLKCTIRAHYEHRSNTVPNGLRHRHIATRFCQAFEMQVDGLGRAGDRVVESVAG